jgi:hypothetical protein
MGPFQTAPFAKTNAIIPIEHVAFDQGHFRTRPSITLNLPFFTAKRFETEMACLATVCLWLKPEGCGSSILSP